MPAPTEDDKQKKSTMPRCTLVAVLVVVLLLLLAFLVMRDGKKPMMGGKWKARGGCACVAPR